jgi:hypothetical protein
MAQDNGLLNGILMNISGLKVLLVCKADTVPIAQKTKTRAILPRQMALTFRIAILIGN